MIKPLFDPFKVDPTIGSIIERALNEDIGSIDLTTANLVPPDLMGTAFFLAKQDIVLCGLSLAFEVMKKVDNRITWKEEYHDGDRINSGTTVATVSGPYGSLLTAERTALNFLTHLSGIATLTAKFVEKTYGTSASIYDTRKTIPGLRILEKYAVAAGGGANHRFGLYDAVLIKNNHLATGKTITQLVAEARGRSPQAKFIEVEVETIDQVREAVNVKPDIIMLDNMEISNIRLSRSIIPHTIEVEVSGRVSLESVKAIADCGVNRISVGALTHSAPAADLSLRIIPDHVD